jgi:hypothetical protein
MVPFFTDGSGYQGLVGAAAAAPMAGIYLRIHLGAIEDSSVYVAELHGIEMALARFVQWKERSAAPVGQDKPQVSQSTEQVSQKLDLVSKSTEPVSQSQDLECPVKMAIFSDSQAAIQAIANPKRSSGQYMIDLIYHHIRTLRSLTPTSSVIPAEIRWIPAHVGVPGNEMADVEAKLAAENPSGADYRGADIRLASSARRWVRQRMKERWIKEWAASKVAIPYHQLVEMPHKKVLKLYQGLPKPYTSIIMQMRTERIGLKHFLYKHITQRRGDDEEDKSNRGRCLCEEGSQTPQHILLQCPLYTDLRATLLSELRHKTELGNSTAYNAIVSDSQAIGYVAKFMHQTGLLGQFRHVDADEIEHELNMEMLEETSNGH